MKERGKNRVSRNILFRILFRILDFKGQEKQADTETEKS